ncbi:8-oxo-dGTP pyrophosphatase MutT (NUDIX family) [Angulomicrobium tetraedrale]|uniref:8-oxo-dGTP pyrophosphatase MutT (NUDIX family) n=1 Tax=Ancylobacter tetraedralis TaxID=217068 RepID=A0A839Z7L9_9HYPH|nr:NUDIX domain-containing protein [Ancylobacter tetraedralis]MBB3771143.1 8-oxo-dGTP pyrophosphatase MutT (NUDIX family) [Ancylobacter tetraedralis]
MIPTDVSARFDVPRAPATEPTAARAAAPVRPVDAATLVLVDRSRRTPRILLGRRNPALKFMPGKFVFPGGRVDPQDRRVPVYGMLDTESERRLLARVTRPSAARARALALAAIRETCEETGLLIGTREAGTPENLPPSWQGFGDAGVFPSLEALTFVARAITPPSLPRRFDTRFFLADAGEIAHREERNIGPDTELVELAWMTFSEAKAAEVPRITLVIIEEVEARLKAGNRPWTPVPFYFSRAGRMLRETLA